MLQLGFTDNFPIAFNRLPCSILFIPYTEQARGNHFVFSINEYDITPLYMRCFRIADRFNVVAHGTGSRLCQTAGEHSSL